jgi:hypothetical protein
MKSKSFFTAKRIILALSVILAFTVFRCVYDFNSQLSELEKTFEKPHKLGDPNLIVINDSISPNKKYKYVAYQFDNGGFGYSRLWWSIIEINEIDLDYGILPDGYKATGWTDSNQVIIEKWKPHYGIKKEIELNTGDVFNGIPIKIIEESRSENNY